MIEIKGLGKSYGPKKVLEKVNLTVPDASVFGLVGINGAGKTTLLRMMADVLRPDEGTVEYDGENIAGNAKKRKELFFLPDDPYYAAGTTVEKLVELYKSFYSFDDELFSRYEKLFSLERRTPVRNFSKGMKRQAFAALAIACRPKYLLLDEAFDGLDPLARLELKRGIISLEGTTAVISSHSLRELEDICSGFALLDGGAVADAGDLSETLERVHKFQAAFEEPVPRERFPFECLSFESEGRVVRFVVRGGREEIVSALKALSPIFVEEIKVDFEELFLCEVKSRGYLS
ncbi:MAG TPA: ABC transporter ATP-binding protein [Candidatus Gallimonas gallistercoris]|uniref:ABC transporter ATP-binding protein n=1 Tax=Candidatus Gallimonas gallistercoris TaxID=2838602 RepID=A0A9D2H219_9FIRM|nr:ABC transporter ATP-binding protein [Candidatus Gallimonas gallistercoris]